MRSKIKTNINLVVAILIAALCPIANADVQSSITGNFNNTAIAAGDRISFTAVAQTSGLGNSKVTIFVRKSTITFISNNTQYSISAPDTNITYDPSATSATLSFNAGNNQWQITRPPSTSDNTLLSAAQFPVPAGGLPGGITNVTWSVSLSADTAGIGVKWMWAAGVYTSFSTDYNALAVKPVDDKKISQYQNSDHAGTPENYKPYVIGGATGNGGTNYVGLYTGTVTVSLPKVVAPTANAGGPYSALVSQAITFDGTASTDPDGYALAYSWNFGDGATGTGATPLHAYGSSGTFTVTVTVNDGRSINGTAITSATVTLPPPPQISATRNPQPNGAGWNNSPVTVTFTCLDPNVGIYSCTQPLTVSSQGANQAAQGTAVNNAGESTSTTVDVSIDETTPTITSVSSPSPNANGWNNTPVSISFTCSDILSGVGTCPSAQSANGEGAGQTFAGTAFDNAGNSSSATATVNIDETAPVVSITSPANGAVLTSASTTVSGAVSDALSGVSMVTCNGIAAVGSNGSFNCGLQLVSGSNTIQVQAVDLAGNSSNTSVTVTYNSVPPTQLFITPTQASMLVNDVRSMNLVGQVGQLVSGATWSVSDPSVLSLAAGDPPQLTALVQGTATLTANYGSLNATMTVNVYPGTSLPLGTPIWSVDPLPGDSSVLSVFPANPVNTGDPDLYSVEGTQTLRAFTIDGRQLWVSKIKGPSAGASAQMPAQVTASVVPRIQTSSVQSSPNVYRDNLQNTTVGSNPLQKFQDSHMRLLSRSLHRGSTGSVKNMSLAPAVATTAAYTPFTIKAFPMNDGGTLALVFNLSQTGSPNYDSLIKTDSHGVPIWQYDSAVPGFFENAPAIGPDNTVYEIEAFLVDPSTANARVVALDGATGATKFIDSIPPNQLLVNGTPSFPGFNGGQVLPSPLSVMPDGSLQFVYPKCIRSEVVPNNGPISSLTEHDLLELYQVQPNGSMAALDITHFDFQNNACANGVCGEPDPFGQLWNPEGAIPDGQGGTLASWHDTTAVTTDPTAGNKITHFDSLGNGNSFQVPLLHTWGTNGQDGENLVLGENNSVYATDTYGVTAFDLTSGVTQWQWTPGNNDHVALLSANDPGGATVLDFDSNSGFLSNEITFDTNGTITDPPLSSNITDAMYLSDDQLIVLTATNQIAAVQGRDPVLALNNWSLPHGAPKSACLSDPALVLVATQDCHKHSSSADLYARYPTYSLRVGTNKNKKPDQQYTVFEFIPQNPTNCGVDGYNNLNPCQFADGHIPFNEFDDEISTGLFGAAFDRTQYFLYGLPNQKLWGVMQIYRTLPDGSLQAKQPNSVFNQIHAVPHADPLIDGQTDPWLASWDGSAQSCSSTGSLYFP